MSNGSTLRLPTPGTPERTRRRRWPWILLGLVIVLLVLLVVLDRVAVAYAENQAAQQMQSQGFPTKPDVSIEGFPFLTQVASRRIDHVPASNVKEGPVTLNIVADATDILLDPGFQSGTISHVTGTGVIPFSSVASAFGAGGSGLTISSAGGNNVKVSLNVLGLDVSMAGSVESTGPNTLKVHLNPPTGIPVSLPIPSDFTIHIPALPLHLTIQSVKVTSQGVVVHATGSDIKFTQSGGLG